MFDTEKNIIEYNSIESFNPVQKKALKAGLLKNSLVVSSPTGSGKTLIAELASLNSIMNNHRKVVYTCPLRALASEHFHDFKSKYSELGIKMTISTGDFDSSSKYLSNYDIIFTTYEKLSSLIRHKSDWLSSIGLLVVDEIHEIDSDRGPTLEVTITQLRLISPKIQILGLSATIPNADELSKWLDAKLVESDYRPIRLKEGVYFNDHIKYVDDREEITFKGEPLIALSHDVLEKQKQALIFANTRKRAESISDKIAIKTRNYLTEKEKKILEKKAEEILAVLESPTEQCKRLARAVKNGASFHHAGLLEKQRHIVEGLFRDRTLKLLSATPTLAAGVNLPAYTVIMSSIYRYGMYGAEKLPVREVKQMCGRAGRPKYDTEGRAILISKSELEQQDLIEYYINGELEDIQSKLGIEPILRMHLLACIAAGFVHDLASMEEFFSKTFYAIQYKDLKELFYQINIILSELEEMEFIISNEKRIEATPIGRRVSELYLDPVSAHKLITALKKNQNEVLFYLYTLVNTYEFSPYFNVPKKREAEMWELLQTKKEYLPVNADIEMFEDPQMLRKFFSTLILDDWISEVTEQKIIDDYSVQPGILNSKLRIVEWLVYSSIELSKLLKIEQHYKHLGLLQKRLKYGVKEELVHLTEIKYIGRVRARKLYKNNIKGIQDLKKIDLEDLSRMLSPGVALQIKNQLGQEKNITKEKKMKLKRIEKKGQSDLTEF